MSAERDDFAEFYAASYGRVVALEAPTVDARIDSMFRAALGRPPDEAERARFSGLAKELASLHKASPDQILANREVWTDMAHTIFNLKEFLYLR